MLPSLPFCQRLLKSTTGDFGAEKAEGASEGGGGRLAEREGAEQENGE